MTSITFDDLENIYAKLFPIMYYGTSTVCEIDDIFYAPRSEGQPEFIVFHPNNFDKIKACGLSLVHLKDMSDKEHGKYFMERLNQLAKEYFKVEPIDYPWKMWYNGS